MKNLQTWAALGTLAALAAAGPCRAQVLTDLSLEDLLAQDVSSVAKRPQVVHEAPAAVFVIGREDIRRSGATTLPDLLRMAPGLEVADLIGGRSAVTARGFNGQFANKLLVLVDGRAVYLSVVSGVAWDQQLVPVEDIERIEVVRGPGAALWGANAVNGVINIITKHPIDTLRSAASVQTDGQEAHRIYLRQGFRVGETGALRLYGVTHSETGGGLFGNIPLTDEAQGGQLGFRYDVQATDADAVTLQGDLQRGHFTPTSIAVLTGVNNQRGNFSGQNILGRWTRTGDAGARTSLQVYFDRVERQQFVDIDVERRMFDIDLSHQFRAGGRHDLVWGVSYRRIANRIDATGVFRILDADQDLFGGFVQDDISLVPKRLTLSLGAKLEHSRSGVEFQPSVRAIWTDPDGWSVWAAGSRAARTPSDLELDSIADLRPIPVVVSARGMADAERLTAFEIGWRGRIGRVATLDATAYHNSYSRLIGVAGAPAIYEGAPVLLYTLGKLTATRGYGAEVSLDARLRPWWTVKAAASWQDLKTDPITGLYVVLGSLGGERSPQGQVSLRSMIDIGDTVDVDVWLRHVGALQDGLTKAYTNLDLRLAWRPTPALELSLRGANLLDRHSAEIRTDVGTFVVDPSATARRAVLLTAAVRY